MDIKYRIILDIIYFEFLCVVMMILGVFASKLIDFFRERSKQKISISVENYFKRLIKNKDSFQSKRFPRKWRRLDILLRIVACFDKDSNNKIWQTIRIKLLQSIILPKARKATRSKNWILQFYAAQSFELYAEAEDHVFITRLIKSKVPVIRLAALRAAINSESEAAFDSIIQQIQNYPTLTQSVYMQAFNNPSPRTRSYIEKFLKLSSNPTIRRICYRILLKYPPGEIKWDMTEDINSKNKNLKLAALRFITHVRQKSAIPILIEQLRDRHWETKVVVLNALGYLQAQEAIPEIVACLQDDNWWVRLNGALALKNLGEKGNQALLLISDRIDVDQKSLEVARHVLDAL